MLSLQGSKCNWNIAVTLQWSLKIVMYLDVVSSRFKMQLRHCSDIAATLQLSLKIVIMHFRCCLFKVQNATETLQRHCSNIAMITENCYYVFLMLSFQGSKCNWDLAATLQRHCSDIAATKSLSSNLTLEESTSTIIEQIVKWSLQCRCNQDVSQSHLEPWWVNTYIASLTN